MMLSSLRKPRTWAWLAGICGLLVVGIAGLGGLLLRQQLAALQSAPMTLDNGARIAVEEVHGGWFATQAILRLDWPLDTERQLSVRLANDINHGPFPRDLLANFDLRPALLTDRVQLLSLEQLRGEQQQLLPAQFNADLRVSYLGRLQAVLQADTPKLPLGGWQLAATGLQLAIDGTSDAVDLQLQAQSVQLQPDAVVAVQTVTLRAPRLNLQAAQLSSQPNGELTLAAEQIEMQQGGAPLLRLAGFDQRSTLLNNATELTMDSQLALWDQPVGQLKQSVQAEGLDWPALLQALGGQPQAWAMALPAASRVQGEMLALENAVGSSLLRLEKTAGEQPLHITARLSRPMFFAALESNVALKQQGAAIARQQALQLYGFVSQPLLQTGLFQSSEAGLLAELELDGNGLRSTLPTTFLSQHHSRSNP
jgi:uncharacterized protein YdgA (DUF945 family)